MDAFNDDENLDVLQNIEAVIVLVHRDHPGVIDLDVADALEAMARHYHAEEEGRQPPVARLSEPAQHVANAVRELCEWRMGRIPASDAEMDDPEPVEAAVIVACLRKILKSVRRWNQRNGRTGYLDFIKDYVQ